MVLSMIRPTKHPKTGVYRVRLGIPARLRPTAKELFGRSAEFIQNLGTKDPVEAKERSPEALASLRALLASVEATYRDQNVTLTERQVRALAGAWYASEIAKWADDPGPVSRWERNETFLLDQLETEGEPSADPDTWTQVVVLSEEDRHDAATLLASTGLPGHKDAIERVGLAVWEAKRELSQVMQRRARGDWSEDDNLRKFPAPMQARTAYGSSATAVVLAGGCTIDTLLEGWALDRGWKLDMRPMPRSLYDRVRTAERLAAFLGHRVADVVTKEDAIRWKEDMQRRSLHAATIRNDISEMSAVWRWGVSNRKLRTEGNPFAGILPPKQRRKKVVRAFTDAEAASILYAARNEHGFMRWLPWVLCLTGARLNEVCQSNRDDVTVIDGIHTIRIHDEETGRTVKNADSRRIIPLHPALIEEGFLAYVAALPAGSPLWPDIAPDGLLGLRSTTAGKRIARWLRASCGINDPLISPNHSWRHYFITMCRRTVMPVEVRSAITGHSAKADESASYGEGMGTMVQVMGTYLARISPPLVDGVPVQPTG